MKKVFTTIEGYTKALKDHPPTPEPPKNLRGGSAQDKFGGRVRYSTQDGGRVEILIEQSSHRPNHMETIKMLGDGAEDLYNWLGSVLGKKD